MEAVYIFAKSCFQLLVYGGDLFKLRPKTEKMRKVTL